MKKIMMMLLLNACTITGLTVADIVHEEKGSVEVFMCSEVNCYDFFHAFINDSEAVHCAFYNADDGIESLNTEQKTILIKNKNKRGLMHNKFCVSDSLVLTGSFNPLPKPSHDNLMLINSSTIATNYFDEFDEIKTGNGNVRTRNSKVKLNNILVENYFCPEDDCKDKVVEKLSKANTSIAFMTFSFTHPDIANKLILKHKQGIVIKGLFEKSGNNAYSKHDFLLSNGLDVKMFAEKVNIHHKVFIIDNRTVITGSMNPTKAGDEKNDENMVIIHNKAVADQFLREFEMLWNN